jgi:hypothetical protein
LTKAKIFSQDILTNKLNNQEKLILSCEKMKATRVWFSLIMLLLFSTVTYLSAPANATGDTELPSITILSPTNNMIIDKVNLSFGIRISKPADWFVPYYGTIFDHAIGKITSVQYNLDGMQSGNISLNDPDIILPPHDIDFSYNLTNLSEGQHNLNISVYGKIYGKSIVGSPQIVTFYVNAKPLKLEVISPQSQTYNTSEIDLAVTSSEPISWMGYKLDNTTFIAISNNTELTELPVGYHNLTVSANDTAGETAISQTVGFTIAAPPKETQPFPTIQVIAVSITCVTLIGIALLLYFRKQKRLIKT